MKRISKGILKHFVASPFIVAACTAVPLVYISLPVFRLFFLGAASLAVLLSFVSYFHSGNSAFIRISLAGAIGILVGIASVSRIAQFAPGLPTKTIASVKGKLLDDPRSFVSGIGQNSMEERGMAMMELTEAGTPQSMVRCSARGRTLVFFPAGTMPRLRDFGRGAELFIEGHFLPNDTENSMDSAAAVSPFRASSVHIIKPAPLLERTRTAIRSAVLEKFKPKAWGGLAAALLLGTRENLESSLAVSFRNAGLSHILALSGMHLAFLSAMLAFVLKKPLGKKGSLIAGFVFIVLYVLLVGPQPSLVRAVIMYGMGSFLVLTGTTRQSFAVLSAAFLVQILRDPSSAYSISFVLSYLALGGILALSGPLLVLLRGRLPGFLAMGFGASASAFFATAPLVTAVFGVLRPAGISAGLIAAPLSGVFMALSLLWLLLAKLPLVGMIAEPILDLSLTALHFVIQWTIGFFARFPGIKTMPAAVCIITPLLIAGLYVFSLRQERYRNELAPFA